VAFSIAQSGTLNPLRWVPTGGQTPRFIGLDPTERRLYAANQGSNVIVPFEIDHESGDLTLVQETIPIGTPTCITFAVLGVS
jgi:6-phosphogluconolactonase (cycloisomerase 2 family)